MLIFLDKLDGKVERSMHASLIERVTCAELEMIVKSMAKGKTPGCDGFCVEFYLIV